MPMILALDGGGTKTRCAVSDGVSILGRGLSSGCNIVRLGEAAARRGIHEAMHQAFAAASIEPSRVEAVCIGVAGSAVLHVREAVQSIIAEFVSGPVLVVGDEEIAFEAFFSGGPGVLVIAGTGSIAFGRNAQGETAHSGGHGFIISDEGSGQWIGRTAVSECLRALDSGRQCGLMPLLLSTFGVRTAGELIEAANAVPLTDFSRLLPVVLKAEQNDDPIAREILCRASEELAAIAKAVAAKLAIPEQELRIALAGGVFEHCVLVREEFERALHRTHPHSEVAGLVAEPLLGAISLAAGCLARNAAPVCG